MSTPKYENPPVVETVISVQFPELLGFRNAHFGTYWSTIADKFPTPTDQARLPQVSENFPKRYASQRPEFRVGSGTPERVWFSSASETELIQVQPDRFLLNWRLGEDNTYPSFEANVERFRSEFEAFQTFCERSGLETPAPQLCEVTYVNHIFPEKGESASGLFATVFAGVEWDLSDTFLPIPEAVTFNRVFVIPENAGRLYAEASIAVLQDKPDQGDFVALRLTGRVLHKDEGPQDVAGSLRLAHDWVVCGFACLTERRIQDERWGRIH